MKVLLLCRYDDLGASSRVRTLQYVPYLHRNGVSVRVSYLFSNSYLKALYKKKSRVGFLLTAYFRRFFNLFTVNNYDLVLIEKELFPFMPAFFERFLQFIGIAYIVDYDDALFHRYDSHKSPLVRFLLGKKIDIVMKHALVVIVGNNYLAERAKRAGAQRIHIIPTVVDTVKYAQGNVLPIKKEVIVGWVGTPKTSHYLIPLLPVFEKLQKLLNIRFVAIGANEADFSNSVVEVWSWTEDAEVSAIKKLDIGIMPLKDSPWERGKCGYKLIQYMACGLPVIASPVGINTEIIEDGVNGLLAETESNWEEAISELVNSTQLRLGMGQKARDTIEKHYALKVQQEHFLYAIESAFNHKNQ